MYLAGLVSSTFMMSNRPAANVELVELSLEDEYLPPKPVEGHKDLHRDHLSNGDGHLNGTMICNYDSNLTQTITEIKNGNTSVVPSASNEKSKVRSRRRISVEDLPADLYMEPLNPLLLRSPESDAASLGSQKKLQIRSYLQERAVRVLRKLGLEKQDLDQEWSFWMSGAAQADKTVTVTEVTSSMTTVSLRSKIGSPLLSSGVQHHPLELTQELEKYRLSDADASISDAEPGEPSGKSCEEIGRNIINIESLPRTNEAFERFLQELERIEESESLKERKPYTKKVGAGEVAPQNYGEEIVSVSKLCIEQPDEPIREESRDPEAPIIVPENVNLECRSEAFSSLDKPTVLLIPSLSSPMMERSSPQSLSPVVSLSCPMMEKSSLMSLSPSQSLSGSVIANSTPQSLSPLPSFSSPVMEKSSLPSVSPMPSLSNPAMEMSSIPSLSPMPSLSSPVMEKSSLQNLSPLPSFSSPMMEKMQGDYASTESPYSINKELPSLPKLVVRIVGSKAVKKGKESRNSSKLTGLDIQDLSFRRWKRESPPKMRPTSTPSTLQVLTSGASHDAEVPADDYAKTIGVNSISASSETRFSKSRDGTDESLKNEKSMTTDQAKSSPPNYEAFLNLRTFDLGLRGATANVDSDGRKCRDEPQRGNHSPSSFTCRLSPMSLFSDDPEPLQWNLSPFHDKFADFGQAHEEASICSRSPRSVLSQEPEDVSHFTRNVRESCKTRWETRPPWDSSCTYSYKYASSDMESPPKTGYRQQSFCTFQYNVTGEMGSTSSDEYRDAAPDTATLVYEDRQPSSSPELPYFRDAKQREPWLDELDDTDLEFLFPLDFKNKNKDLITTVLQARKQVSTTASPQMSKESPRRLSEDMITTLLKVRKQVSTTASPQMPQESPRRSTEYLVTTVLKVRRQVASIASPQTPRESPRGPNEYMVTTAPDACREASGMTLSSSPQESMKTANTDTIAILPDVGIENSEMAGLTTPQAGVRPTNQKTCVPLVPSQLHSTNSTPARSPAKRDSSTSRRLRFQEKSSDVFVASLSRGVSSERQNALPPKPASRRHVNFAPDLVREFPISTPNPHQKSKPFPVQVPLPRGDANREARPPNAKSWHAHEEEGPSIMSSRRRWSCRYESSTAQERSAKSGWGSVEGTKVRRRQKIATSLPFCSGSLFSWPQKLAFKVSKSRPADSSDDDMVVVDAHSFGRSARTDADAVRRILRGSQKKYANLSVADIMKHDFQ